jgi:hypothetical protein
MLVKFQCFKKYREKSNLGKFCFGVDNSLKTNEHFSYIPLLFGSTKV